MKRIFGFALVAASLAACNIQSRDADRVKRDSVTVVTPPLSATDLIYIREEGDVTYRDGKVMVWRNNAYTEADKDITLDDGIVVRKNGEVTHNDSVRRLEEGESVTRTGRFFNKAGKVVEDAWDATKRGVSKAADAVEKGVNKAGDKVKDVVD